MKFPCGCEKRHNCGAYSTYTHGCRGAACLIAKREYQRILRGQEPKAPPSIIKRWKDRLK